MFNDLTKVEAIPHSGLGPTGGVPRQRKNVNTRTEAYK